MKDGIQRDSSEEEKGLTMPLSGTKKYCLHFTFFWEPQSTPTPNLPIKNSTIKKFRETMEDA